MAPDPSDREHGVAGDDTEITLGTGKLLFLFFGLVAICAAFFSLGYTLGRKSESPALATNPSVPTVSARTAAEKPAEETPALSAPPLTFYKTVEQKDANPQLAPAADTGTAANEATPADSATKPQPAASNPAPVDPMALPSSASYYVQVAAVSKQEDADSLVDALKKKQYAAFTTTNSPTDKLFRVQVGPFSDIKDAEATRARLISDGYNPILKK